MVGLDQHEVQDQRGKDQARGSAGQEPRPPTATGHRARRNQTSIAATAATTGFANACRDGWQLQRDQRRDLDHADRLAAEPLGRGRSSQGKASAAAAKA